MGNKRKRERCKSVKNILCTRCLRLNRLRLIVRYGQALNIYIIIYEGHAGGKSWKARDISLRFLRISWRVKKEKKWMKNIGGSSLRIMIVLCSNYIWSFSKIFTWLQKIVECNKIRWNCLLKLSEKTRNVRLNLFESSVFLLESKRSHSNRG